MLQRVHRVSLFLCLFLSPLGNAEVIRFEGYLREVQEGTNEGYALFPATPMEILLPNNLVRPISFVLVELPNDYIPCVGKYVVIEGIWKGMDSPVFDNIAILKATWVADDHWTNADCESEEAHDFFDRHVFVMARGACAIARWRALKSGLTLLEGKDGWLIETHPDGTKTQIRSLENHNLTY